MNSGDVERDPRAQWRSVGKSRSSFILESFSELNDVTIQANPELLQKVQAVFTEIQKLVSEDLKFES